MDRRNHEGRSQAMRHLLEVLTAQGQRVGTDLCVAGLSRDATTRMVKRLAFKCLVKLVGGKWVPTTLLQCPPDLHPEP